MIPDPHCIAQGERPYVSSDFAGPVDRGMYEHGASPAKDRLDSPFNAILMMRVGPREELSLLVVFTVRSEFTITEGLVIGKIGANFDAELIGKRFKFILGLDTESAGQIRLMIQEDKC